MKNSRNSRLYRSLLAATFLINGTFQLAAPVLAQTAEPPTEAGTAITNKATATYSDGVSPTIQTESNTVSITVAEVAGITVSNAGVDNVTNAGQPVRAGNTANFKFNVTNVGNDPTKVFLPSASALNGSGAISNNATATAVTYQVLNPNDTVNTTLTPSPVSVTGNGIQTLSLPPGGRIRVNVTVGVSTSATRPDVSVRLGNTPATGTPPVLQQNIERAANPDDVYTVDNTDGTSGETAGSPTNGVREASSEQTIGIGATTAQPFALITMTRGTYATSGADGPTDDTLPYNLNLQVLNTPPASAPTGTTADDLYPTYVPGISTSGTPSTYRVLVSDVIPTGTVLNAVPTAPPGWEPVYSTQAPTGPAYAANWSRFDPNSPIDLTTVTRIGFIPTSNISVARSSNIPFTFTVKVTNLDQGDQIANIAQVFGENATATPTNATVPSVYDESGDQSPNNDSNGDNAPDVAVNNTTGVANPSTQGTDANGNNTGTGLGGEDNLFTIPLVTASFLNGTVDRTNGDRHPDAVGPTSNNDDFTNRSSAVSPGNVPLVGFTNSLGNSGTSPVSATLLPEAANLTDLPVGQTIITIRNSAGNTVTYTVTKSTATGTPTVVASGVPVVVSVPAGGTAQYDVTVDLPNNTPQNTAYDVPITAFIDTDGNRLPNGSETRNRTIDRVYAGFVELVKESRILQSDGTPVSGPQGIFSDAPKTPSPGNIIEYQVTYRNISEVPTAGTGAQYNVGLNASNLVITEDGTTGGNNWALDQDANGQIDTINVDGSATATNTNSSVTSAITFFSGNPATTTSATTNPAVSKYVNTLTGSIQPGNSGTFTFQRKIN